MRNSWTPSAWLPVRSIGASLSIYSHEGARKRDAIVDGVSGSEQDITEALEDLVDIGILVQRRNGYDFADDYRAFAVLVAILALCSIGKLQMLGISSREGVLPTEEIYF